MTFSGSKPPADIELCKQRSTVRPLRPRPTQCARYARYGHIDVTCTSTIRCVQCVGPHPPAECAAEQPKCLFCGAKHLPTEPRCPRWQEERRLLELRKESTTPISRAEALALARASNTNASVNSAKQRNYHPVTKGLSYAAATGVAAPAAATSDKKSSAFSVLVAALAAALKFLLSDCPIRPLCTAALATQTALTQDGE